MTELTPGEKKQPMPTERQPTRGRETSPHGIKKKIRIFLAIFLITLATDRDAAALEEGSGNVPTVNVLTVDAESAETENSESDISATTELVTPTADNALVGSITENEQTGEVMVRDVTSSMILQVPSERGQLLSVGAIEDIRWIATEAQTQAYWDHIWALCFEGLINNNAVDELDREYSDILGVSTFDGVLEWLGSHRDSWPNVRLGEHGRWINPNLPVIITLLPIDLMQAAGRHWRRYPWMYIRLNNVDRVNPYIFSGVTGTEGGNLNVFFYKLEPTPSGQTSALLYANSAIVDLVVAGTARNGGAYVSEGQNTARVSLLLEKLGVVLGSNSSSNHPFSVNGVRN